MVALAVVVLAPLGWWGAHSLDRPKPHPRLAAVRRVADPTTTSTTTIRSTVSDGLTLVATLPGDEQGYGAPDGAPTIDVPGSWNGAVSSLPVIATTPGWLDVRLAQRPNESTAWIRSSGIELTGTPYRIVVNLQTMHLELFDNGRMVLDAPAGIGTSTDPTPTGSFFVAFFADPPNPGYGPYVIVTSAHSNTITDFEESGDAIIAIHGPLGADAAIGTTGAAISHGCVRLHDSDLAQLADVSPGSPVDIID